MNIYEALRLATLFLAPAVAILAVTGWYRRHDPDLRLLFVSTAWTVLAISYALVEQLIHDSPAGPRAITTFSALAVMAAATVLVNWRDKLAREGDEQREQSVGKHESAIQSTQPVKAVIAQPDGTTTEAKLVQAPATQQKYPWRTTLRTAIQIVLALASATPLLIAAVEGENTGLLGAAGAQALAVAAAITRLMSVKAVDDWLDRLGLSSKPKSDTDTVEAHPE